MTALVIARVSSSAVCAVTSHGAGGGAGVVLVGGGVVVAMEVGGVGDGRSGSGLMQLEMNAGEPVERDEDETGNRAVHELV